MVGRRFEVNHGAGGIGRHLGGRGALRQGRLEFGEGSSTRCEKQLVLDKTINQNNLLLYAHVFPKQKSFRVLAA